MADKIKKRKCKRKGCDVVFAKRSQLDMFCSFECAVQHKSDLEEKKQSTGKAPYRIPQVSKKRLEQNKLYRKKRDEFMSRPENKWCPVMKTLYNKRVPTTDLHHTNGRENERLLDEFYWLAVSREGHRWIHEHPTAARKMGWLI